MREVVNAFDATLKLTPTNEERVQITLQATRQMNEGIMKRWYPTLVITAENIN